jgi:hypothetical protein
LKRRCYLVYALAPKGVTAAQANDLFNEYIGDPERGLAVFHDHFIGRHGGIAVFDLQTDAEVEMLDDPGPLAGWELAWYPLTFSRTAVGFVAQTDFTLRAYRDVDLARLIDEEAPDRRQWWNRP